MLRRLSKRFYTMSKDPYLQNFTYDLPDINYTIREISDLDKISKIVKYCDLFNVACLNVELYLKATRFMCQEEAERDA